jgi:hypothetical protein
MNLIGVSHLFLWVNFLAFTIHSESFRNFLNSQRAIGNSYQLQDTLSPLLVLFPHDVVKDSMISVIETLGEPF